MNDRILARQSAQLGLIDGFIKDIKQTIERACVKQADVSFANACEGWH